jgi:DNA-damage-inducible protein D
LINNVISFQVSDIKLFEAKKVRTHWDEEKELWFFSVIDVIEALTGTDRPRKYWSDLKGKLAKDGSQLSENIVQLKMPAEDGKMREKDAADVKSYCVSFNPFHRPKQDHSNNGLPKLVTSELKKPTRQRRTTCHQNGASL